MGSGGAWMNIPDSIRPFLNEIAQRLWSGRATVMVGAGFSKNADPSFPDWNQLGDLFYEKAHGRKPGANERKYLNVLRLAEEVKAAIGRPALEQLLRSQIPDRTVAPSKLHVELLKLPWNDVFTTNYDTLLERASAQILTRRYQPVVNKEDIPYAEKPRIVKLHGSFPSERPFIISEEDYRRYPTQNAIFVNTVQQSLLENTFCLVGFSGDDPNFLQWIGWIRDNLGQDQSQKIYLLGVFNVSAARMHLLAERGIIIVDLSEIDGVAKDDHGPGLEKCIDYLRSMQPDALEWPKGAGNFQPRGFVVTSEEFKSISEAWSAERRQYPGWLVAPYDTRRVLWGQTISWVNRIPGDENHEEKTFLDLEYLAELCWRLQSCLIPLDERIAARCRKAISEYWPLHGKPPTDKVKFSMADKQYRDVPWLKLRSQWIALHLYLLRHYREEGWDADWTEVYRSIRRGYRYLSSEERQRLGYESCLFYLFTLDIGRAEKALREWHTTDSEPYWAAKKAIVAAEVSSYTLSLEESLKEALIQTRNRILSPGDYTDYKSISCEAYQIFLLNLVQRDLGQERKTAPTDSEKAKLWDYFRKHWQANPPSPNARYPHISRTVNRERFDSAEEDYDDLLDNPAREDELASYLRTIRGEQRAMDRREQYAHLDSLKVHRCDPGAEIKLLQLAASSAVERRQRGGTQTDFDLDYRVSIVHWDSLAHPNLGAYQLLRFIEEVGAPFRVGNATIDKKSFLASAIAVGKSSPHWAIHIVIRIGDAKGAEALLDRHFLCKLDSRTTNRIFETCMRALTTVLATEPRSEPQVSLNGLRDRIAGVVPEILSRLCSRLSNTARWRIIDFLRSAYSSTEKVVFRGMGNLVRRLIVAFPETEHFKLLPRLLEIRAPSSLPQAVIDEYPNPFLYLDSNKIPKPEAWSFQIVPSFIDRVLSRAELAPPQQHQWLISTLVRLQEFKVLSQSQKKRLGKVLWLNIEPRTGLPGNTDFYPFAFLATPYPEDRNPVQLFKKYIQSLPFPVHGTGDKSAGLRMTGGRIEVIREILGAQGIVPDFWTKEDLEPILHGLVDWWDTDKALLESGKSSEGPWPSSNDEFRARFQRALSLISEVLGPVICHRTGIQCPPLERIVSEMRGYGLATLAAEASTTEPSPENLTFIVERAKLVIGTNDETRRVDGFRALQCVLLRVTELEAQVHTERILQILLDYLDWCPLERSEPALKLMSYSFQAKEILKIRDYQERIAYLLERLSAATEYANESLQTDFVRFLEIRRSAAVLASILHGTESQKSEVLERVLSKWESICLSENEFVEIRNAWIDNHSGEGSHQQGR